MTGTSPFGAGRRALAAVGPVALPLALFLAAMRLLPGLAGDTAMSAGLGGSLAGALAIALVAAATAMPTRWLRPNLILAAILGLCAHSLLLTHPGVPWGYDTQSHLWGLSAYGSELDAGNWLPLWLHRIGMGMPLPVFYGPLVFWIAAPVLVLGLGPALTLKVLLVGAGAAASTSAFAVARRTTGDGAAALTAAVAVAFAPYRLLDAHYRVALPETVAFALVPPVLFLGWRFLEAGGGRRLAAAAGVAALLVLTHTLSGLMVATVVGTAWLLVLLVRLRRVAEWWASARRLAVLAGLTGVLASCFLLPVAVDLSSTWEGARSGAAIEERYAQAAAQTGDVLMRRSWDQLRRPRGEVSDQPMPLYFGAALLGILLVGAICGVSLHRPDATSEPKAVLPWVALAAVALLLALGPVARATATLPLLGSLQYPWRFLAIATCAAAIAGAVGSRWLSSIVPSRWCRWIPALLAALLVADAQPMTGAATWLPPYRGFGWFQMPDATGAGPNLGFHSVDGRPPLRVAGTFLPPERPAANQPNSAGGVGLVDNVYPEWATIAVRRRTSVRTVDATVLAQAGVGLWLPSGTSEPIALAPSPYASWHRPGHADEPPLPCNFERGSGTIRVVTPGRKGTLVALEQCFPGWQLRTPQGWQPAACTRDGSLEAAVRRGQTAVEFRFQRWTVARTVGWLMTGLGLAIAAVLWRRDPGQAGAGAERDLRTETPDGR